MLKNFPLYYCNVVLLIYFISLVLVRAGVLKLDSPFSLAVYLLAWAIPVIGIPLVFYIGNRIKKTTTVKNNTLFYIILLSHVAVIPFLLYFIPYRGQQITNKVASKTLIIMGIIVALYYVNVRLRGYTIKQVYKLE